jgi:DNA-binding CsgD family transcriptional regulator
LTQLEQLVSTPAAPTPAWYTDRSVGATRGAAAHRLDVDQFSEQQKRLLGVFFQHRDRQMSYADVAAMLGKSACTVKNQMNQIRQKADLFDCVTGPQSRNFFRLKDDLKVEKLLKVGRPVGRPGSFAASDQSGDEYLPAVERPFY